MSHIRSSKLRSATATAVVLVLASLVLAACGSSSKGSSSTTTSTSSSAKAAAGGPGGAGSKRFTALRECLAKNGITLPKPTGGQRKPGAGGPGGAGAGGLLGGGGAGGRQLPKGVNKEKYEAAIKKCGGFQAGGGHFKRGSGSNFASPAAKAALTKFAACMREDGVDVPAPNTSGKGPVFNTKGLNTSSTTFKAAETKCASILRAAYKPTEGTGAGGAPPSSAG
jgi:hypothetical protein